VPWYRAQRPDLFAKAFVAEKTVLDLAGIMNPGVLADRL
jgi:alkyldihydroxyacetonephosphate synthase